MSLATLGHFVPLDWRYPVPVVLHGEVSVKLSTDLLLQQRRIGFKMELEAKL